MNVKTIPRRMPDHGVSIRAFVRHIPEELIDGCPAGDRRSGVCPIAWK